MVMATGAIGQRSSIEELTVDECWALLSRFEVGRVAVSVADDSPLVVPVNYLLDGRVIVFRSAAGTKLSALRVHPVSFELDQINPRTRTGWSVLVAGVAYEATPEEVTQLDLEPWANDVDRPVWVRIVPRVVTGRRITLPEYIPTTNGYL